MAFQIENVKFGILGDEDVENLSVCVINNPSLTTDYGALYDPRLGCTQNNSLCETCKKDVWTCPGHFGHVNLNVPIIIFHKQCVQMLKCFCLECHRILCTKQMLQLNGVKGYAQTIEYLSDLNQCDRCNTPHPEIRLSTTDMIITAHHKFKTFKASKELTPTMIKFIFDDIPDEDVKLLSVNTSMFHPKNLVLTKFLVIPTCCRPRMITPDNISDDDLTLMLATIIKSNNWLFNHTTLVDATPDEKEEYIKNTTIIKVQILAYCDNSKGTVSHSTNHKPMSGLKCRINRKDGLIRQHVMGKRCDRTARTVVGPDSTLKLNEVAIPERMARVLTIQEHVTHMSINHLQKLVNDGQASMIIKADNKKINVKHAGINKGTKISHGDVIIRKIKEKDKIVEKQIVVTNCGMPLFSTDFIIRRDDKSRIREPIIPPKKRIIKLSLGDKVERFLKNGDWVFVNRMPTLHRNSMQGMKVVVKKCKTIRVNLAITAGFNMDFDGDEANIYCCETITSRAELALIANAKHRLLSIQSNKPEMLIVQDSLVAAYLMTKQETIMSQQDFMNCLLRTNALENYDYAERCLEIFRETKISHLTSAALFGFILPKDFHIRYPEPSSLIIKNGIVISGYFDKTILKATPNAIVRILCLEYNDTIAVDFIDNIQFITNAWLELNPFSVGIADCLLTDPAIRSEIDDTIQKYFMEASMVSKSTNIPHIREARINCALNKAKDIGLKIAKEALQSDNNFLSTVKSGSKGDFFNIAQITGLLGQQNVYSARPKPSVTNQTRTMIHYPFQIFEPNRLYESCGFITSSFIKGLNPQQMFFHSMSGREGIINTAMGTATSGYIHRCCVKLTEDLKTEYDGTVRDAKGNIFQFVYGNHGFDPSWVSFKNGHVAPVNFARLRDRLNSFATGPKVFVDIERIIEKCKWKTTIPHEIFDSIWQQHEKYLRDELKCIEIASDVKREFEDTVIEKYHVRRITPGETVGILAAQSIGERQTQTNLNTFHTAGKLQEQGTERVSQLLNLTKSLKYPSCTIYFNQRYATAEQVRSAVNSSIVETYLKDVVQGNPEIEVDDTISIIFHLSLKKIFEIRLTPDEIARAIEKTFPTFQLEIYSASVVVVIDEKIDADAISNELLELKICGIKGIKAMYLEYFNQEFYIITEGSNLKQLLIHHLIDTTRLYCNDVWEVYECLGILATKKMLLRDLEKAVDGINRVHLELLVDRMTLKGKPTSITRYTMRTADTGPLSKATFEESVDLLISSAVRTEVDNISSISSAVVCGNIPRVGTGMVDLKMDLDKIIPKSILGNVIERIPDVFY